MLKFAVIELVRTTPFTFSRRLCPTAVFFERQRSKCEHYNVNCLLLFAERAKTTCSINSFCNISRFEVFFSGRFQIYFIKRLRSGKCCSFLRWRVKSKFDHARFDGLLFVSLGRSRSSWLDARVPYYLVAES